MYKSIFLFFLISQTVFGQFEFKGVVNTPFYEGRAYLSIINDCNKKEFFITEDILQDIQIASDGTFRFHGDFLEKENRIYKIHIDNCSESVSDYKHLLNHCEHSREVVFIANNTDQIYFPVNPLSQILCDVNQSTNPLSSSIIQLEELEESLLAKLQFSKNDFQRQTIYKTYFKSLQEYSLTFNEPLVELYAYYMYAKESSMGYPYYLTDLKKNAYYDGLLDRLEEYYPHTVYTELYTNKLAKDRYPFVKNKQTIFETFTYILIGLLLLSFGVIYGLVKKLKNKEVGRKVNYKQVLTQQEQKVFELMPTHSNKDIANALFISLSTVKTHINNIYSKLSISSRKEIDQFL